MYWQHWMTTNNVAPSIVTKSYQWAPPFPTLDRMKEKELKWEQKCHASWPDLKFWFIFPQCVEHWKKACWLLYLAFIWRDTVINQIGLLIPPIFYTCSLAMPVTITDQVNKYLMHFFWRKYGKDKHGAYLNCLDKVCKPKRQGGLGHLKRGPSNRPCMSFAGIRTLFAIQGYPSNVFWTSPDV